MNIFAIESSCDETAASVVRNGREVLSNIVATSQDIHVKTGGIVPENAARQQAKSMLPVLENALYDAFKTKDLSKALERVDALAVTYGPGLIGSLLVGVETAKTLSLLTKKPLVPVNHLIGHIYANWLDKIGPEPEFPALALVVSGGHTDMVLMKSHPSKHKDSIEWIGGTRDDAAGEAFDKTARLLGLPYPGGPAISNTADQYLLKNKKGLRIFPRPMINDDNFDFSFSGLKTSVMRYVNDKQKDIDVNKLAANIQESIVDVLAIKSIKAINKYKPKSFLLAGGVSANKRLRSRLEYEIQANKTTTTLHVPDIKYCTDNATYIASAAHYNYQPVAWQEVSADPQLTIADHK